MMHVWLALDPETRRVAMQDREFGDEDFPRGTRGLSWPQREATIDEETWTRLLAGALPYHEQDALHRDLWTANGDTPWPES